MGDIVYNNAGYATPVETMLGQLEDLGAGQQVFFAKALAGMYAATPAAPGQAQQPGLKSSLNTVLAKQPFPSMEESAI